MSGREKGARYALMAYPGKERDPGTHMTDIYRRRGRSAHFSSRIGADVDHVQFLLAAAPFGGGVGYPCGFFSESRDGIFFFSKGRGTMSSHFGTFRSRVAIDAHE